MGMDKPGCTYLPLRQGQTTTFTRERKNKFYLHMCIV